MSIWKTIIKHLANTCAQKQSRCFSRKSPAAMGSTLENGISAVSDDNCAVVPTKYSAIDAEKSFNQPSLDVIRLAGVTNSGFVIDSDNEAQSHLQRPVDTTKNELKRKADWKSSIAQRIYILTWIRTYDRSAAVSDLIAGTTVGLTMIAQAIAYAALAGLPSQYGLYSAFVGSLVYVFLGTIKEVSIGPTSLMALLTAQYTVDKPPEYAVILAFLAGSVELLMGVFRLSFIVDFISIPVTTAFTSAASLIIVGAQLKNFLGLKYSSKRFADTLYQLAIRIQDSSMWDGMLGVVCCVFLLTLRKVKDIPMDETTKRGRIIKKSLWYLSISSNALIVLTTSCIAYHFPKGTAPFQLSGTVEAGVPKISWPPFEIQHNNATIGFLEICGDLGSAIIVVPLVAVLANVAISKAFTTGSTVNATQEMITLGVCNILGSCFRSMPTCGAFTRSAVIQASGVRTPMAGLYTASLTILALSVLTPYFYYIPTATLASVLVIAVVFMINLKLPLVLWRSNREEFFAWLGTFVICLAIGVELGLLFGILLNIAKLLFMWARPDTSRNIERVGNCQYIGIQPNVGMFYPGVDNLRERSSKCAEAVDYRLPVVIDCSRIVGLDYTSAQGIAGIKSDLAKKNQILVLLNLENRLHGRILSKNVHFANSKAALCEILLDHNDHVDDERKLSANKTSNLGFKVESLCKADNKETSNL